MKIVRRPRIALTVAALGLALTTTGCAYLNPIQTHDFYQAADGTNANPTGLGVRNAVLVVDAERTGTFYTSVTNETSEPGVVELEGTYEGSVVFSASVEVPAGGVTMVGGEGNQAVTATDVQADAGSIMELTVSAPGQEDVTISLPVQDDALGYYPSDGGGIPSDAGGEG